MRGYNIRIHPSGSGCLGKKLRIGAIRLLVFAAVLFVGALGWCTAYGFPSEGEKTQNREQRLFDDGELIPEEEREILNESIHDVKTKIGMDVVVVTAYNDGRRSAREYADDYYDNGGFGTGKNSSGVLYLIYMDAPGRQGGECWISTEGGMIRILTDSRIERMLDNVTEPLRSENYSESVEIFLQETEYYVDRGIETGQYIYDTETGEISVYKSIRWYEALFAVFISAVAAGSFSMGVKYRYGMKASDRGAVNGLLAYRAEAKFSFDTMEDRLVNTYVTSVPVPKVSSHSSGGGRSSGGSRSSGRSSTHRSSSGRRHGGGGRRF